MAKQDEMILVALDYLFKETDEDHKTNATKINEYAQNEYGIDIDHRCLNKFLKKLKEICDKYPDKYPFILQSNDGERPRYYLEQKYFSKEDIISIASAIKDTFYIDEDSSKELLDKFLDVVTNKYQKTEIMKALDSHEKRSHHISKQTLSKIEKIDKAIKEKRRIEYRLVNSDNQETFINHFYCVRWLGTEPFAIISSNGKLISERLKDIEIVDIEESCYNDPRCKFDIADEYRGKYENPYKEIEDVIVPVADTYSRRICKFSFPNSPYALETIKSSYEDFFKWPLRWKLIGSKKCFAEIEIKGEAFIEWACQPNVANLIKVIGDEEILKGLAIYYAKILHRNHLDKYKIDWSDENGRNKN